MAIVTWRDTERTTLGVGDFVCETCGPAPYTRQSVRRHVRLTSVNLLPISPQHEVVVCDTCGVERSVDVLDEVGAAEDGSSLREVAVRLMAAMVVADGVVAEEELEAVIQASALLPDGALDRDEALAAVRDAENDPIVVVAGSGDAFSQAECELLLLVALSIAMADGELHDEELLLLTSIGDALGLDVAEGLAELGDLI